MKSDMILPKFINTYLEGNINLLKGSLQNAIVQQYGDRATILKDDKVSPMFVKLGQSQGLKNQEALIRVHLGNTRKADVITPIVGDFDENLETLELGYFAYEYYLMATYCQDNGYPTIDAAQNNGYNIGDLNKFLFIPQPDSELKHKKLVDATQSANIEMPLEEIIRKREELGLGVYDTAPVIFVGYTMDGLEGGTGNKMEKIAKLTQERMSEISDVLWNQDYFTFIIQAFKPKRIKDISQHHGNKRVKSSRFSMKRSW